MIRATLAQDLLDFVPKMREADKQEIEALSGLDPLASVSVGLFESTSCMTGFGKSGEIAGIFGVVPVVPARVGAVWFLSTDEIEHNVRELLVEGRKWLDEQNALYPVLTNVVSESNDVHRRLIQHLGFQFKDPIDNYGVGKIRVIPFERKRDV